MKTKNRLSALLLALGLLLPLPAAAETAEADDSVCYTLQDATGRILTQIGARLSPDDEYITSENHRYRVSAVDDNAQRAVAVFVENVILPEPVLAAAQQDWVPRIAIYCTHTDESYVPSSGTESEAEGGEILDVAQALKDHLNRHGCEAVMDDANHVPHDAGAYRRSRKTAVSLMKEERPTLLLDIHRDGVPAEQYETEVEGENAAKVRIVIGRGNQNRDANEEFALQVKAVADKLYPGLVKDIYLGKGSYNQDLMPRAILLEFGTHESDKEHVLESTGFMAQVLSSALGASTPETTPSQTTTQGMTTQGMTTTAGRTSKASPSTTVIQGSQQSASGSSGGGAAWGSIAAIVLVLGGIGIACLLFFSRGGKGRAGRFFRELTGTGHRDDEN